ncbi:Mss4-like protein, partial [Ilyonectria sp. MPI-CAGE-AT-0026]
LCHCRSCKRSTGAGFTTNIILLATAFHHDSGSLTTYTSKGGSGNDVTLHFCPSCGSHLYVTGAAAPGIIILKTGTLDDSSLNNTRFRPMAEMFCDEKYSWLSDVEGAKRLAG